MASYQFFKFTFSGADQGNCLATGNWREEIKKAENYLQEALNNLFTTKIPKKQNVACERLENYVEHGEGFITSLIICNNKSHKYKEKMEKKSLDFHPGNRVIIDNRPGVRMMAIENSGSFDRKPEEVSKILERAINKKLDERELKVEILPMRREGRFFDMVEERVNGLHDKISYLKLDIPSDDKIRQLDTSDDVMEKLMAFNAINAMLHAKKGVYQASTDSKDGLTLDRKDAELVELVTSCIVSGYTVTAKFKNSGTLKSTSLSKVVETLNDNTVNKFRKGIVELDGKSQMEKWLDNVRFSNTIRHEEFEVEE